MGLLISWRPPILYIPPSATCASRPVMALPQVPSSAPWVEVTENTIDLSHIPPQTPKERNASKANIKRNQLLLASPSSPSKNIKVYRCLISDDQNPNFKDSVEEKDILSAMSRMIHRTTSNIYPGLPPCNLLSPFLSAPLVEGYRWILTQLWFCQFEYVRILTFGCSYRVVQRGLVLLYRPLSLSLRCSPPPQKTPTNGIPHCLSNLRFRETATLPFR